jgi:hypothetical protein
MQSDLSRRAFLERTAVAAALVMVARPAAAADGMYVSLNGSLTRQMPWPDFVRLAGKLGYGGVDVNLNAAKAEGADATRALLQEMNLTPAVANLPVPFLTLDEAAFQEAFKLLPENAQFANAIGLHRMMAVLSPASPVPKDERRTFVKAAVGLATPWPAMSGADPCTGSNIDGPVRAGLRLADDAKPMPPDTAPPRSVRMSPNRLSVTTTS